METKADKKRRTDRASYHRCYQRNKEAGLCVKCKEPAENGRVRCKKCLRKNSLYSAHLKAELYKNCKENGICSSCGKNPVVDQTSRCAECAEKHTIRSKKLYQLRLDKGLCPKCEAPLKPGRALCADCLSDQAANLRERRRKKREMEKENASITP